MPWRRGTARKSRGLPIQISRLIIITYSAIYWHLCFTCLLQKITVVDRHVAPRHLPLLLSQDLNLLLGNWEPPWMEAALPLVAPRVFSMENVGTLWAPTGCQTLPNFFSIASFFFKNIYPNTLKWVTNARNWNYSPLATSKSIHLQYSQRLKKSESAQIIWVKSEKPKWSVHFLK